MTKETKLREDIIEAGYVAVEELIKVARETIVGDDVVTIKKKKKTASTDDDDFDYDTGVAAEKLKLAAMAKKVAIFDALEILDRLADENTALIAAKKLAEEGGFDEPRKGGFAESRAR